VVVASLQAVAAVRQGIQHLDDNESTCTAVAIRAFGATSDDIVVD